MAVQNGRAAWGDDVGGTLYSVRRQWPLEELVPVGGSRQILFGSQGDSGGDACRSTGGQPGCDERSRGQEKRRRDERDWIQRADLKKQFAQASPGCSSQEQTERDSTANRQGTFP